MGALRVPEIKIKNLTLRSHHSNNARNRSLRCGEVFRKSESIEGAKEPKALTPESLFFRALRMAAGRPEGSPRWRKDIGRTRKASSALCMATD
jgi:hypothetical protein